MYVIDVSIYEFVLFGIVCLVFIEDVIVCVDYVVKNEFFFYFCGVGMGVVGEFFGWGLIFDFVYLMCWVLDV